MADRRLAGPPARRAARSATCPRRALSPNETYAALVAAAGYLPLTLSGEDYLRAAAGALAADQRLRHPHRLPHLRLSRARPVRGAALRGHRAGAGSGRSTTTPTTPPRCSCAPRTGGSPPPWTHLPMVAGAVRRLHLAPRPPPGRRERPGRHQRDRGRPGPRRAAHPRRRPARSTSAPTGSPPAPGSPRPRTARRRATTTRRRQRRTTGQRQPVMGRWPTVIPFGIFDADAEAERWL